jgi:putative DNA primase/helicase
VAKLYSEANKKKAAQKLSGGEKKEKDGAEEGADKTKATIAALLKPVLPDVEPPILKRYITSNTTGEALGVLLQQNPNGLLVFRDELLALLDRLDEEGHSDEREMYLSGWNGDTHYTSDRIGRGLDLHIESLCISVVGGTQPARLSQYLQQVRRGGRHNDGLIQRFGLLVWPDISPTWVNVDRKPDKAAARAAFEVFQHLDDMDWRAIGAARDIGFGGEEEGLPYLRFSADAQILFDDWRRGLEARLRSGDLDPMLESHLAKYRKLVPGVALICHLVDAWAETEDGTVKDLVVGPVSASAMVRAQEWAAYLETHAARVYASSNLAATDAAYAIIAKVKSGHLKAEGFSSKEVWRPQWSRLRDRDTVMAALKLLEDYDWLRVRKVETSGRTATIYEVNPKVLP